jgi:BMFP domain-containing protein YqiC
MLESSDIPAYKMSDKTPHKPKKAANETADLMRMLLEIKNEIKETESNLKKSIDHKFENISKKLDVKITKEFSEMKTHIELEMGRMSVKLEKLEMRVSAIEEKDYSNKEEVFSPEVTVVALNLDENPNEDLTKLVSELFKTGLGIRDIEPVRTHRMKSKDTRPGLVKIELRCKQDKINILRAKSQLKTSSSFKRVYLRSSMTHSERIISMNFREILNELPNGHTYRVAGNGRLLKKDRWEDNEPENIGNRMYVGRGRGRGRGTSRGRGIGRGNVRSNNDD